MKTIAAFKKSAIPLISGMVLLLLGCLNPHVSSGQDWPVSFDGASALKPAQLEISLYGAGSYYTAKYSGKSHSGTTGYTPGLRVGVGIVKNFDVKLGYSRGFYKYSTRLEDSKVNNILIMPKVSFLKEHLACQLPFTVMVAGWSYEGQSKTETYYLLSPRIIGTIRIRQIFEINLSPVFEAFIPGHGVDPSYFIGGNVGMAFSTNLRRWSVRPEGFISYYLPHADQSGYKFINYGWGLAFTYNIDFKKE